MRGSIRVIALALAASGIAYGQTDLSTWPQVRTQLFVTDAKGAPLSGLPPSSILLKENGRPQAITALTPMADPQSVCVLIDTSGSMFQRTAAITSAASRFIQNLPPDDEVCVATFAWHLKINQKFTPDRSRALAATNQLGNANGGSAMYDAVMGLTKYMQNAARFTSRTMLIFSDGADNASAADRDAFNQVRTLLEHDRSTVVHMVRVLPDRDDSPSQKRSDEQAVRSLTEVGGGLPYFPRNEQEMIADVDGLNRAMQAGYTLAYTTGNPQKDGRERLVEITVDKAHGGGKAIARAPEGFYAPSQ